jgi:hypothetical protein
MGNEKIIILGHREFGRTALLDKISQDIIFIEHEDKSSGTIVVNGIEYETIEEKSNNSKAFAKIAQLELMAMSMGRYYGESGYNRKLPDGIDIVAEYGLIQQKKSRLSKWERNAVEITFERTYRRKQPNP